MDSHGKAIAKLEQIVDFAELDRLRQSLDERRRLRDASPDNQPAVEGSRDLSQAVCLTLIAGPLELGFELPESPARDEAAAALTDVTPENLLEARICRQWLRFAAGLAEPADVDEMGGLVDEPIWPPVRDLLFRILAFSGRRDALAKLYSGDTQLDLPTADALLEAHLKRDPEPNWTAALVLDGPWSGQLAIAWRDLLAAETIIALGGDRQHAIGRLAELVQIAVTSHARSYDEQLSNRIATRAAAALQRAQLPVGHVETAVVESEAARRIPHWEHECLRGLARWRAGDLDGALSALRSAALVNPHQNAVHLAAAGLLAELSCESAFAELALAAPTRQVLLARAALSARLERWDDTAAALDQLSGDAEPSQEPLRWSWFAARQHFLDQHQILSAALAEQRGKWNEARAAWQGVGDERVKQTTRQAREAYAAGRELSALADGQSWRRGVLEQRLKAAELQIGGVPLVGRDLFFRAIAFCETSPDRAADDLQRLLRQQEWVRGEQRAGGGRLVVVGDQLLRAGRPHEAVTAYEYAHAAGASAAAERLAVALVVAALAAESEESAECLERTLTRCRELAELSPWPSLLAAFAMLTRGNAEAAVELLEVAQLRGAPRATCDAVRACCSMVSGTETPTDDELAKLDLPAGAAAILRLIADPELDVSRIQQLAHAWGDDWMAVCPIDPFWAAQCLLANWCQEGDWISARRLAEQLTRTNPERCEPLRTLVDLSRALELGAQGKLDEAADALENLQ